ncbi:DUF6884 domain-containing protein [Micromonospora olivasterospora]|uniref:DUF6884 domain-containing protein n=1 Tax=Micromonospora olivasterospora TaxID=1880 RepID=A0A562I9K4_MICOL|nr:DUF6884 domain-containing protein [Micromonospora olivasterospora]TWH67314.1 hypothetical protein JD77_02288 [Micromonospora olivasterospora]
MTRPGDNRSCHRAPQLHAATGHVADHAATLAAARTPSEALAALAALDAACREAREWLAVDLVLIDGWSYADVGRALGTTRQAACKAYADAVNTRMRRSVVGRDDAVVVVPCGSAKLDRPAPAGLMYTGSYHRACRRAADRLGGRLVILSARYGLLDPDTVIEPYDLRMGQPGTVGVPTLRAQARRLGIDVAGSVTVLAGREYADAVSAVWPHAVRPLDGTRGMPEQMAVLAELARTPTTPVVTSPRFPASFMEGRAAA